jgi:predicted metal-binding membrane protein
MAVQPGSRSSEPLPQRRFAAWLRDDDHRWPAAGLTIVVAACWAYLIYADWSMRHMDIVSMAMPSLGAWTSADFALVGTMWGVMMIAMMVPSVLPALSVHRQVILSRSPPGLANLQSAGFLLGYLLAWACFSVVATLAQWGLHDALVISPAMTITQPAVAGALLIAAGVYQWTPLKSTCLRGCNAPLAFLVRHWHDGTYGALRTGLAHGAYCTGCCWLLMALLFVYGVMNLAWIVVITAVVLAEKLLPPNRWFHRAVGLVLIAWGSLVATF